MLSNTGVVHEHCAILIIHYTICFEINDSSCGCFLECSKPINLCVSFVFVGPELTPLLLIMDSSTNCQAPPQAAYFL